MAKINRAGGGGGHQTDHGRKYWSDKNTEYLEQKSRESLEDNQDISVLYFQIDWAQSKRNFYGEMTIKKFVNPFGIKVRGAVKLEQGEEQQNQGIPNKIMKMVFSCYTEELKELNIDPQLGDYFAYGQRIYNIYNRTIKDYGPGNIIGNRKRMRIDFFAVQDDDEVLAKNPWGENLGLDIQIRGNGSIDNL